MGFKHLNLFLEVFCYKSCVVPALELALYQDNFPWDTSVQFFSRQRVPLLQWNEEASDGWGSGPGCQRDLSHHPPH